MPNDGARMSSQSAQVQQTAIIEEGVSLGRGVQVWHYAQIRKGAKIGDFSVIGSHTYIGLGVVIGSNSKIQNSAKIYEPASIAEGVFIGPNAVLTNDLHPRAVNINGTRKSTADWNPAGVSVCKGASIGAGAICVAPITLGEWSMIAAGAVVVTDVKSFALVAGVPAKQIAWVGRSGQILKRINEEQFECPLTFEKYRIQNDTLFCES
jgi:UDP-2-acetamido-3-amino-2,3-dideoxy-glucuronate N-acetyltransferase